MSKVLRPDFHRTTPFVADLIFDVSSRVQFRHVEDAGSPLRVAM